MTVGLVLLSVTVAGCTQAPAPTTVVVVTVPPPEQTSQTTAPAVITTPAAPERTTAGAPTSTTASHAMPLPRIVVAGGEGRSAPRSLQKTADDIADGNIEAIVTKCWTRAPERIRDALTHAGRQDLLAALTTPMRGSQGGWYWESASTTVLVSWSEAESPYACPDFGPSTVTDVDAALVLRRLDARHLGTPIRASDLEGNYPLVCEFRNFLAPDGGTADSEAEIDPALWPAIHRLGSARLVALKSAQGGGRFARAGTSVPYADVVGGEAGLCLERVQP